MEERRKALVRFLRRAGDGILLSEHRVRGDRIVRFTSPTDAIWRAATCRKLNLPCGPPGNHAPHYASSSSSALASFKSSVSKLSVNQP